MPVRLRETTRTPPMVLGCPLLTAATVYVRARRIIGFTLCIITCSRPCPRRRLSEPETPEEAREVVVVQKSARA